MKLKWLVVNADDLGLSIGTNLGIEQAHQRGILTSASLFATTPALFHALKIIKRNPKLGVGIHLSLTLGKPVLSPSLVPLLVDKNGDFQSSFGKLIIKSLISEKFMEQVTKELTAQVKKLYSLKIKIDHINGQQHFHTIPTIYPLVYRMAKKYKLILRYPDESFYLIPTPKNLIKYLLIRFFLLFDTKPNSSRFYGLLHTGNMNQNNVRKILSCVKPGLTEILFHPAFYTKANKDLFDKQKATSFMSDPNRYREIRTLISKETRDLIKKNRITPTTFSKK